MTGSPTSSMNDTSNCAGSSGERSEGSASDSTLTHQSASPGGVGVRFCRIAAFAGGAERGLVRPHRRGRRTIFRAWSHVDCAYRYADDRLTTVAGRRRPRSIALIGGCHARLVIAGYLGQVMPTSTATRSSP